MPPHCLFLLSPLPSPSPPVSSSVSARILSTSLLSPCRRRCCPVPRHACFCSVQLHLATQSLLSSPSPLRTGAQMGSSSALTSGLDFSFGKDFERSIMRRLGRKVHFSPRIPSSPFFFSWLPFDATCLDSLRSLLLLLCILVWVVILKRLMSPF